MRSYASRLSALGVLLVTGWASADEKSEPKTEPPVIGLPPLPAGPPAVFPSQEAEQGEPPLAGIHGGHVFVRDPKDIVRIYPAARLRTDFYYAPGAPALPALVGENAPKNTFGPTFAVRRVEFEVSGELFSRLFFTAGVELGGERIGNTEFIGPDTPRFAMASAHSGRLVPADVTVSYAFRRWLNFTAGQQLLPFGLSNRTREYAQPLLERPIAIRGFAVPWDRDLGLTLWGEAGPRETLHYELGIFTGDGYEHPFADAIPEFSGRVYTRPLSTLGKRAINQLQLGFSARVGSRDQRRVTYDYPTFASNQGWVFWQPGYVDSLNRVTHVLPSGLQRALGGELRVPFDLPGGRGIDVQSEFYYLENNTREAVEGFIAANTERLGRVKGIGWYAQASFWLCGNAFASGEPGVVKPEHAELEHPEPIKRGLELVAVASGISASYDGASRSDPGFEDRLTPRSNITVYQFGGGLQFWFGNNFRAGLHYMGYLAPHGGEAENLALTPGNVPDRDGVVSGKHSHHELAVRLAAGF